MGTQTHRHQSTRVPVSTQGATLRSASRGPTGLEVGTLNSLKSRRVLALILTLTLTLTLTQLTTEPKSASPSPNPNPNPSPNANQLWYEANCCGSTEAAIKARQGLARGGTASTTATLHPTPYTLHPAPYTLHPTPYTLHPTPYTLHPVHPTPYTLTRRARSGTVPTTAKWASAALPHQANPSRGRLVTGQPGRGRHPSPNTSLSLSAAPADVDHSAVAPQQAPNPCRADAGAGNPAWEDVWTGCTLG